MGLIVIAGLPVVVVVAMMVFSTLQVRAARRSGLLPEPGQATMADVERLAKARQLVWAVRCYRELHRCGLSEAKRAVEARFPVV